MAYSRRCKTSTAGRSFYGCDPAPKSVAELTAAIVPGHLRPGRAISRAAVSQHLKVLLQAELVSCTPEGNRNVYRLQRKGVEELQEYLEQLLKAAEKG